MAKPRMDLPAFVGKLLEVMRQAVGPAWSPCHRSLFTVTRRSQALAGRSNGRRRRLRGRSRQMSRTRTRERAYAL